MVLSGMGGLRGGIWAVVNVVMLDVLKKVCGGVLGGCGLAGSGNRWWS